MEHFDHWTLSLQQWKNTLEIFPQHLRVVFDRRDRNVNAPTAIVPVGLGVWRGDHPSLTLDSYTKVISGAADLHRIPKVADLAKDAVSMFEATVDHRGAGSFTVTGDTPVWADPTDRDDCVAITGISLREGFVVIGTANLDR